MELLSCGVAYLPSKGALGGILVMLDKRVVEKVDECVWGILRWLCFTNVVDRFQWSLSSMYDPNTNTE